MKTEIKNLRTRFVIQVPIVSFFKKYKNQKPNLPKMKRAMKNYLSPGTMIIGELHVAIKKQILNT
jgi:hypothetical protein